MRFCCDIPRDISRSLRVPAASVLARKFATLAAMQVCARYPSLAANRTRPRAGGGAAKVSAQAAGSSLLLRPELDPPAGVALALMSENESGRHEPSRADVSSKLGTRKRPQALTAFPSFTLPPCLLIYYH